jgi:hypothetical protein
VLKDSYWRWPERQLGGNTIDFYILVFGYSFNESMHQITPHLYPPEKTSAHTRTGYRFLQDAVARMLTLFLPLPTVTPAPTAPVNELTGTV